jgi:Protein of unknown function (DUF1573)
MNRSFRAAILALPVFTLLSWGGTALRAQTPMEAKPAAVPAAPAPPAAPAAAPETTGAKPKAVAVEPIKDVGTVPKGEKILHDFVIRNDGNAPLQITDVKPACGCTVAQFDKLIGRGKTGVVHTVLDTTTFNGPIAKGVTVFTNDPDNPQIELTLRAKVEPYINVKPGYARYITVQGESKEGNIIQTLTAPDGTPFDIVSAESKIPGLKATFREAKAEERVAEVPGKQWRVEMALSNEAPVGALADYLTITTNHPKQKLVQIPVSGFIRPVMAATPPVADFGKVEVKESFKKSLNLRNFATEAIKVVSVENNVKGIETVLEPIEPGREYQVKVTLKPELAKGAFNGKLIVRTDSAKIPVIEIPLKGTVI